MPQALMMETSSDFSLARWVVILHKSLYGKTLAVLESFQQDDQFIFITNFGHFDSSEVVTFEFYEEALRYSKRLIKSMSLK